MSPKLPGSKYSLVYKFGANFLNICAIVTIISISAIFGVNQENLHYDPQPMVMITGLVIIFPLLAFILKNGNDFIFEKKKILSVLVIILTIVLEIVLGIMNDVDTVVICTMWVPLILSVMFFTFAWHRISSIYLNEMSYAVQSYIMGMLLFGIFGGYYLREGVAFPMMISGIAVVIALYAQLRLLNKGFLKLIE